MFLEVSFKARPRFSRTTARQLTWCLFIALLFIFRNGYQFNCYDQEEHLPLVYKLADPSLYPHDYFVQPASSHVMVRTCYAKTVYFFSKIFSVETACFLLFIACLTFTGFFILKIAERWCGAGPGSWLAPLFVLLLYNAWTIGGNPVMDLQLLGSTFSVMFCLAAIRRFTDERYGTAGMLLGIASMFQVLMGLHLVLVLALVLFFISGKASLKDIRKLVLFFILFASPILVPVLYRQFFTHGAQDAALANYALINFRQAHHYLPRVFPAAAYVHHAALLLLAAVILLLTKTGNRRFFFLFTGIIIAGCLVYALCFELWQVPFVAKTQWFKTTVWTTICAGIVIAGFAGQLLEKFVALQAIRQQWVQRTLLLSCTLLLLHITNQPFFTRASWLGRYMVGKYPHADITKMHEWIRYHTPKDAIILSFPHDASLLCEARRSTPVTYKAIIHEPALIEKWYRDFTRIYSIPDTPGRLNVPRRDFMAAAAKAYDTTCNKSFSVRCRFDYRIAESGTPGVVTDSACIIHREGNYVLLKNNIR